MPLAGLATLDSAKIVALNPYFHDPEQKRWHAGFASALESWHR
jgi:hypothetical protein